jgi:hypothetical protein
VLALKHLILFGGIVHLSILSAGAVMPFVLHWREELRRIGELSRQIIWTHGAFIMLTIASFGLVSLFCAGTLSDGSTLARCVCGFVALFWGIRLVIQFFVFDARPHLRGVWLRVGYHGLTVVFIYLTIVYAWAALVPFAGR